MDSVGLPSDRGPSAVSLPMTYSTDGSNASSANGIGSVTGRVIMSVGELALKGIEVMQIQRRIQSIHTAVVESDGRAKLDSKMCSDLVELSR